MKSSIVQQFRSVEKDGRKGKERMKIRRETKEKREIEILMYL